MDIGNRIKVFRGLAMFTQKELAEKANISRSYLADVEKNRYNPSLDTLDRIISALGITKNDFFKDEIPNQPSDMVKEAPASNVVGEFKSPEEAMKFILEQPAIMGYGGFDIHKMSNEEIIEFANELLRQLKLISYKYKK